jgi:UDP-glucose-4-epimerase GalE
MTRQAVVVTGGAGYVGSHACKALANAGYLPVTFDSLCRGHAKSVKWGPLEQGNILDQTRLREVFRTYSPVAVLHLAALAYVGESIKHPLLYHHVNVSGSLSLLCAMKEEGVRKLVFSSSCATYGIPHEIPISEQSQQLPINPYGSSKLLAEHIIRDVAADNRLSAVALRFFNAAGADPEGELGECHEHETHIIPLMLAAARGEGQPLTIFGEDYPTPDGTCIRDYIHVSDLADAHLRALNYLAQRSGFSAFNLGTGTGYSIRQLIAATESLTGRIVPHNFGLRRPGDPPVLVADPSLAKRTLGWMSRHSSIETIILTAWNWIEKGTSLTPADVQF